MEKEVDVRPENEIWTEEGPIPYEVRYMDVLAHKLCEGPTAPRGEKVVGEPVEKDLQAAIEAEKKASTTHRAA